MLQIIDRSGTAKIERVFARTFVTGTFALNLVETGQRMLHSRPLP
jgi:hypothetical protein